MKKVLEELSIVIGAPIPDEYNIDRPKDMTSEQDILTRVEHLESGIDAIDQDLSEKISNTAARFHEEVVIVNDEVKEVRGIAETTDKKIRELILEFQDLLDTDIKSINDAVDELKKIGEKVSDENLNELFKKIIDKLKKSILKEFEDTFKSWKKLAKKKSKKGKKGEVEVDEDRFEDLVSQVNSLIKAAKITDEVVENTSAIVHNTSKKLHEHADSIGNTIIEFAARFEKIEAQMNGDIDISGIVEEKLKGLQFVSASDIEPLKNELKIIDDTVKELIDDSEKIRSDIEDLRAIVSSPVQHDDTNSKILQELIDDSEKMRSDINSLLSANSDSKIIEELVADSQKMKAEIADVKRTRSVKTIDAPTTQKSLAVKRGKYRVAVRSYRRR